MVPILSIAQHSLICTVKQVKITGTPVFKIEWEWKPE